MTTEEQVYRVDRIISILNDYTTLESQDRLEIVTSEVSKVVNSILNEEGIKSS